MSCSKGHSECVKNKVNLEFFEKGCKIKKLCLNITLNNVKDLHDYQLFIKKYLPKNKVDKVINTFNNLENKKTHKDALKLLNKMGYNGYPILLFLIGKYFINKFDVDSTKIGISKMIDARKNGFIMGSWYILYYYMTILSKIDLYNLNSEDKKMINMVFENINQELIFLKKKKSNINDIKFLSGFHCLYQKNCIRKAINFFKDIDTGESLSILVLLYSQIDDLDKTQKIMEKLYYEHKKKEYAFGLFLCRQNINPKYVCNINELNPRLYGYNLFELLFSMDPFSDYLPKINYGVIIKMKQNIKDEDIKYLTVASENGIAHAQMYLSQVYRYKYILSIAESIPNERFNELSAKYHEMALKKGYFLAKLLFIYYNMYKKCNLDGIIKILKNMSQDNTYVIAFRLSLIHI